MFIITYIKNGWFEFKLSANNYIFVASWSYNYDFDKEFLSALLALLINDCKICYLCVPGEPGADIIKLTKKDNLLVFEAYESDDDSSNINMSSLQTASIEKLIFKATYNIYEFGNSVLLQFDFWNNKLGIDGYLKHWGKYPTQLIHTLEKLLSDYTN